MKDFDQILDDCIEQILNGSASLEECLSQYPAEAARLEPLLRTALSLERSSGMFPTVGFKLGARTQLTQHMREHPRPTVPQKRPVPPLRTAFSLTALAVTLLASGTAYAQTSLPGDSFYSWKITSERALRAVSVDPVGIDLFLAERRVREFHSVSNDPQRSQRALQGYNEVLVRLSAESDKKNRGRIEPVLQNHERSWKSSGVTIPELESFLADKSSPDTSGPQATEVPQTDVPTPAGTPSTPQLQPGPQGNPDATATASPTDTSTATATPSLSLTPDISPTPILSVTP